MMQAPAQLIQPNQLPCVYHADNHLIQTFQHTLSSRIKILAMAV